MAKKLDVVENMRVNVIINGDSAKKELYDLEKATRDLTETNKNLKKERDQLKAAGKQQTEEYKKLSAEIKANNARLNENKDRMTALRREIGVSGMTMAQLRKQATLLRAQLNHMIPGSAEYKRLEADLKVINSRINELRLGARAAEGSLSKLAGGFNKYAALGASVIASVTGVVLSLQKVIDYNGKLSDSLADVRKTTGLTSKEVDELNKSFGTFNTRTSRIELLKLAEDAGRLGITGVENLRAYTEQANKLHVALGDDLSETQIMEIGKMVNIYKVGEATSKDFAGSMDALGSAINEVAASGANQAGFLVEYLKRQAGIAAQTKISAADNVGYAATFDEVGQSVEVSATAMNKVFIDMFKNTEEYSKIAGMGLTEFSELLARDANEAMLKFLEGLNGNNEGLAVMVKKMEELDAGGTRGVQALAALASNTDLVRKRQQIANEALNEATSLTDEYNIKNNNLAAVLEKVNRRINAFLSGDALTGLLTSLVTGVGKLIGALEDADTAMDKSIKRTHESAKANRNLAAEGERLLKRYEELTRDGVKPNAEAKMELDEITLKLKDAFGDSVVEINKETGALILNTQKVREQIQAKRLAADEEAATNASRLVGVQQQKVEVAEQLKIAANEYMLRKQIFEERNKADIEAIKNSRALTAAEKQRQLETLNGYKEMDKAGVVYQSVDNKMAKLIERERELIKGLEELNYTADDALRALLGDDIDPNDIIIPDPETKTDKNAAERRRRLLEQLNKELLRMERATQDARIEMLEDGYLEELVKLRYAHNRKMEDLGAMIMSEEELRKQPLELRKKYAERNAAIEKQMEAETEAHTFREMALIEKGLAQEFKKKEEAFEKEQRLREIEQGKQLAALGNNEKAKEKLQEQFDKENLDRQKAHLEEVIAEFNGIMDSGEFKGMDLSILTEEQKKILTDRLEELGMKLEEIGIKRQALEKGEGWNLGAGAGLDILGFTAGDWELAFSNLSTLEGKIEMAGMAVHSFTEAWGMYFQFVNANENKRLRQFEKQTESERRALDRSLQNKMISQRQYDDAVKGLEKETERRREELEYKQNMRAWKIQLLQSASATALGIARALPNLVLAGIVGSIGGAQTALIAANKPVKGYEEGLYPDWIQVEREQDGKLFNAKYGGQSVSGMVNEPTLVGERPELVISNPDLKRFNPIVTQTLVQEIRRVRGYEEGYTSPEVETMVSGESGEGNKAMITIMAKVANLLEKIDEKGISAYMVRDMENAKKMQDDLERLKKYKQKAEI